MPAELFIIQAIQALVELGAMFLLGQGALYVFAGAQRKQNFAYQLATMLTSPIMKVTRWITPKLIDDRHIPYAAVVLVFWVWIATRVAFANVCAGLDLPACNF